MKLRLARKIQHHARFRRESTEERACVRVWKSLPRAQREAAVAVLRGIFDDLRVIGGGEENDITNPKQGG